MKIVVTGATGNVGGAVVRALAADDRVTEIVGLARRLPDSGVPKTTYVVADVGEDDLTPFFAGADVVVHTAWLFQPTHSPTVTWQANAVGSVRVFEAAAQAGVGALVHTSSVGAYSPAPGRTVDESWPTHSQPHAAYGREKAYAERALDGVEAAHPDLRVVRMRPCFILQRSSASAQKRLMAGPFVPTALVRPGRLPVVPWPKGMTLQTMHTDDVAEAFRLVSLDERAHGAYNVAAGPVIDAETFGRVMGAKVVPVPDVLTRSALSALWHLHVVPAEPALFDLLRSLPLLDASRLRSLGWAPRVPADEALREVLHGMADHAGGASPSQAADSASTRADEVRTGVGETSTPQG